MKSLLSLAITVFVAFAGATSAHAEEMTLTSADGSVALTGPFLGFREMAYVIMYKGQELFVPVLMMNCEGTDCLNLDIIQFVDETANQS
jgi:phosphate transport system substrate-binding protein